MKILIKNGYLVDMVQKEEKVKRKDLLIENDRIIKIAENINCEADKVIDAEGKVVMPGIINCHTHIPMSLFRGYADDSKLDVWLKEKIWPAEDKLTKEDAYYGSLLSCIEMVRSGTTTFNDMYFFCEEIVNATKKLKMRALIGRCMMALEDENDARLKEAIELYEKCNSDMIKINFAVHAPYTCNKKTLEEARKLAKKYNVPVHIHVDETKEEHESIKEKYNMTPLMMLDEVKLLDESHMILAHGIWFEESDIKLLKKMKGGIASCPVSNAKLASGVIKAKKLQENGINVGLGTDGAGSTNTLDMFEEMRLMCYIQKLESLDSSAFSAYRALKMATIDGAKVLGMETEIGTLEEGKKADIIIVDMSKPHLSPLNDVYSNLVYSCNGQDVTHTIINGNIVMENRVVKGIDEKEVIRQCEKITKRIF